MLNLLQTEIIPRSAKNSTKKPQRQICRNLSESLPQSLPRFGPLYGGDESLIRRSKEEAWQHILEKSLPTREAVTTEVYLSEIRQVEEDARRAYGGDESVNILTGTEFRWMMIRDGCFFLQLAFFLLGCKDLLGYAPHHVIFGQNAKTKYWIRSFFFVGNQIPFVVLKRLIKQKFFQQVIVSWKWEWPSDLTRSVLYEFLVLPELEEHHQYYYCIPRRRPGLREANDLLHAVQLLVVGSDEASRDADNHETEEEEEWELTEAEDVEARSPLLTTNAQTSPEASKDAAHDGGGGEDKSRSRGEPDIEAGPGTTNGQTSNQTTHSSPPQQNVGPAGEKRFSTATELNKAGVHFFFRDKGSNGIFFQDWFLFGFLYLPRFRFDENTEMVLENLKKYEIIQPICMGKLEVHSYLRFMSELITTSEDVRHLESKSIIQKRRRNHEKLPEILKRLSTTEEYNQRFRHLSYKISDYSGPSWARLTKIVSLFSIVISILTILQTVYTVLPYYKQGPGQ